MPSTLYLVCGVSGSGKSWACRQAGDAFLYVPHDRCWRHPFKTPSEGMDPKWEPGAVSTHLEEIVKVSKITAKPLLTESPFGERLLRESVEKAGIQVIPLFVVEHPTVVTQRYFNREKKPIPASALSRASSIINRAKEWNAVHGTSEEILTHLRSLKF